MTEKLWGGRFVRDITPEVLDFTHTVSIDTRLLPYDLWQDLAHVVMLARCTIIPSEPACRIVDHLLELGERHRRGELILDPQYEDVHLNIEQMIVRELGLDTGGRMHTARSRNDQVSTDTRMYLREVQLQAIEANLALIDELLNLAAGDFLAVLPGYTHSQAAQPVSVAFWRTAHASMLLRDVGRLRDAYARTNQSPLGACALAGTSFDIDRQLTAGLLGFAEVLTHALDATSARDFMIETAAAIAIGQNTLSRMAEEVVVWSGHEHGLCEVADEFATGSSIMPQKKNPVVAELVRGRSGRTAGTLVQLLTAVKGVSLGYSCDLQEDKPYLWDGIDTYLSSLRVVASQTKTLAFDGARGERLCWDNFSTATELANHLVAEHDVSFRKAHAIVGAVVRRLLERGDTLREVDSVADVLGDLGHPVSSKTLRQLLDPRAAIASYTSSGATGPARVRETRDELAAAAAAHRTWTRERRALLHAAHDDTIQAAEALKSRTAA
jgi:argininosuccinate lyase